MAVLTFMVYIYYTTDVTAEMTSGVPEVPVRTFEDVLEHGYNVIVSSGYNEYLLSQAKEGTAKHRVYKMHIEKGERRGGHAEALSEIVAEPDTLYYSFEDVLAHAGSAGFGGQGLDSIDKNSYNLPQH